jgi:hypothetical protein
MSQKSSRVPRPTEIVMEEFAEERVPWSLDEHLNGCLVGYQTAPSYGAAIFFALEALWGIARDVGIRASAGTIDPAQLDKDWILAPKTDLDVPWIWIRSLATAWETYKTERTPFGQAFGLEGGQGKNPTINTLELMLDQRAIARWIWWRVQQARATDEKFRIEDAVQEAAEKFNKSEGTIRRAWQRFGDLERLRTPE